jgi:hypothetical protein
MSNHNQRPPLVREEDWHCDDCQSVLDTETLRDIGFCASCIRERLNRLADE